jgi:hypothetical protein
MLHYSGKLNAAQLFLYNHFIAMHGTSLHCENKVYKIYKKNCTQ